MRKGFKNIYDLRKKERDWMNSVVHPECNHIVITWHNHWYHQGWHSSALAHRTALNQVYIGGCFFELEKYHLWLLALYHIDKHLTINQGKYENMRRDFIDTLICAALMEKDYVALKSASLERKK